MTRPKDWTAGSVAVAVAAACVAGGAGWALWAVSPAAATLTATHAGVAGLCVLAATRNLRARLEATQQVVDAWNSSEARDELAKSPAAGTPSVALYDQDAALVHQCPPGSADRTPCCERSPWDLPFGDRITVDPALVTCGRQPVEMTVAEADRLIANLQALPGTAEVGQVCARCGKPAGDAIAEAYLDPDGSTMTEMTWLCDDHYAAAMAEDGDRG